MSAAPLTVAQPRRACWRHQAAPRRYVTKQRQGRGEACGRTERPRPARSPVSW